MATYVRGTQFADDLSAVSGGSIIAGGDGDDILRGRKGDDILVGGAGDDQMYGGGGADQFRFFGNQIGGASDTDRIYDLNFGEGDTLVFGNYAGLFADDTGVNAFNGGDAAIIKSWEGLANAVEASGGRITIGGSARTDVLLVHLDNGAGQIQTLYISNGFAAYAAAASDGDLPLL